MNNAKCLTTSVGAQCVCQKGTSGVLCEQSKLLSVNISLKFHFFLFQVNQSINEKNCSLNCQAGGLCIFVGSTPKCHCSQGRTGRLCETRTFKNRFLCFFLPFHFF